MILLTPGPCMTSEKVRQAAAMPDMNHRDPEFLAIFRETKRALLGVYPGTATGWRPYLIGGSGTAAVEAMLTSCVRSGPVLLIDSGYYSHRTKAKLVAHEIPFDVISTRTWLDPIPIEALGAKLPGYEALITTHNETTTGRLHPLGEIGRLCKRSGVKLLVDAMSSFGADEIDFTHLDAVASSANKCLHGLPGLSFVLLREELANEIQEYSPRTVYLSLPFYEGESPPLTPPVPILCALRQALAEIGPEGARSRRDVYQERSAMIRRGLKDRGFKFAIDEADMSSSLTTASIPTGFTSESWLEANREAGFMLYGTKGDLKEKWFQVANMGELTDQHLRLWLAAVDDISAR